MVSWCITDGPNEYIVIRVVASKVTSLKSSVKLPKLRNHAPLLTIQKVMLEKFNHTLLRMIGTLDQDQKDKWQDWVLTLTHAYNCTHCESMGFSPYYLMFGWVPRLPVDIEYGITQPQLMEKS